MKRIKRHIIRLFTLLLLFTAAVNQVWAATVTYHILTLPIDNSIYHMKSEVNGWRLEAVKVVVDNVTEVGLPAHYKSPLATGFTYYKASDITNAGKAATLYDNANIKGVRYKVKGVDPGTEGSSTPVAEGSDIDAQDYYVIYTYNESNTIAKLDGSVNYNIGVKGKGFLSYNRGRNNRPAVVPKGKVDPEMLASDDFMYIKDPGSGISTYWNDGNNKNNRADVESQFFFGFKFEGSDPYHIIIRTSYARNYTFIEKNEEGDKAFVYKWYKGAALMANGVGNVYLASDDHKRYSTTWVSGNPNPTDPGSVSKNGYFHGNNCTWGTVALLNNSNSSGYVLMGSRTVDSNGNPPTTQYYLKLDNNNLNFDNKKTLDEISSNYSIEGIYPIKKVTFKVPTPFYAVEATEDHVVSVSDWVSQYTVENDAIEAKYLPKALYRKYCTFKEKFYKDAARTEEITHFSQATEDPTEGYQVYLDYEVSASAPFKAITPLSSYSDDTWKAATWYELTDENETADRKIKYDKDGDPNQYFKNNGVSSTYDKVSEYAFIGDPYELRVILRSATSGETPTYVGATGDAPVSGTAFTASTSATAGYNWEIPDDDTDGSILLRKFKDTGHWYWDTEETDQNLAYSTTSSTRVKVKELLKCTYTYHIVDLAGNIAAKASIEQTIFMPLSTTVSTTLQSSLPPNIVSPYLVGETLKYYDSYTSRNGDIKRTRLDFHYDTEGPSEQPAISETPNAAADIYVTYTTTHLSDKAIKINQEQPFNVKLNGEYLYCEKVDGVVIIKTTSTPTDLNSDPYLWLLRNNDPYNMLIDNLQARTEMGISGDEYVEDVTVYDDNGGTTTDSRHMGAWVWLNGAALPATSEGAALAFTTTRASAQSFIAKSSTTLGVYEVMVATNTEDARTTYYNIGRPDINVVKVYNNSTYAHGNSVVAFRLEQSTDYTYHLVDMSNHILLEEKSKSPDLVLPSEYVSPLVGTYYYYDIDQFDIDDDVYTLKEPHTALADLSDLYATFTKSDPGDYSGLWPTTGSLTASSAEDVDDKAMLLTSTGHFYYRIGETDVYYDVNVTKPYYTDIYVKYDKNNLVNFNDNASPYLLKFLNPFDAGYYLEDGNDKLTRTKIQAVYPYTNGDGSLNIYGEDMNKEQMDGGASTRPRWIWFFDSENNDPYHVKVHSKSTISYNGVSHPTYLQTYAVHFHQDADPSKKRVVTGGFLPGIASVEPTEYMILGTVDEEEKVHYKLKTTYEIEGARHTVNSFEQYWKTYNMIKQYLLEIPKSEDEFSNEESTWVVPSGKRGELKDKLATLQNTATDDGADLTAKIYALSSTGIYYFRIGSAEPYIYRKVIVETVPIDDPSDYTVSDDCTDADWEGLNYVDGCIWHSYDVIANAVRWNGYNDKSDGHEKKIVEKLEHWFQTFDMGDGTFDIENANIPPVLILLDRHGWEIMRKPLPTTTYPNGPELIALKAYDSPMVGEYKFYSNATKATGCHKYTLRMQNGAERDQIKNGGKHYTSSSLAVLPPITATGVKDNAGVLQDQYVTYTVKDEYENSYEYDLELHEEDQTYVESGKASKFLILQNARFARDNKAATAYYLSKPIFEGTNPPDAKGNVYDMILSPSQVQKDNVSTNVDENKDGIIDDINLWYVQPNLNIDKEMGIKWGTSNNIDDAEPLSEYGTKKKYKDKTGFDPYNIQLKNADISAERDLYMTSQMTTTTLSEGAMVGDYTGGSENITLAAWVDVKDADTYTPNGNEGYDHTYIQLTNQTFMAVQDANGNMQLMPRFDHTQRINVVNSGASSYTTLKDPEDHDLAVVTDNSSMGPQTVFMVRPQLFEYHIIDNEGNEALRYKTAGEYAPSITPHFKSPLATDFKYYFDHVAYTTTTSSKESYTAAGTSDYFKKTATDETTMATAAKALTVIDDYYFRIGESAPYTYKKVTVTKGYVASPATDATYTTADCTETEWTNAVASQQAAASEAAMETAVLSLAAKGLYYYQLGTYKYYMKVIVDGETKTIEDSNLSAYTSYEGGTQQTATDTSDFTTKVESLANGTYYYEIGPLYSYKKVVVTSLNNTIQSDVAAHNDISDREITGSFADAGLNDLKNQVYVRYSYNEDADDNKILQGKWITIKLANKDDGVVASGSLNDDGTGVSLFLGTSKPNPVDNDDRLWQWKFLAAPTDAANIDPYALKIYNRTTNYNKRDVGIKVNGNDRFALLNHSSDDDYALAVAGAGLSDPNYNYTYTFLNGADMTTSSAEPNKAAMTVEETNQFTVADDAEYALAKAALTANGVYYFKITSPSASYKKVTVTSGPSREEETVSETDWSNALAFYEKNENHFTIKSNALSDASKLILNDDVTHIYTYKVINNDDSGNKLAVSEMQTSEQAEEHKYAPYLPVTIQTRLLNEDDYLYYASATQSSGAYTVDVTTELTTLCGLYDDEVYVRYNTYDMDKTPYMVPNKRNATGGSTISVPDDAKYSALNISGGLPYNIIWEGDKMMSVSETSLTNGGSQKLDGSEQYVWRLYGNDPYAIQIRNNTNNKYVNGTSTVSETPTKTYMLLNKDGYEYGILRETCGTNKLTDYGESVTSDNPNYFIIFALSTHRLIYHLIIAKTCPDTDHPKTGEYVNIPFKKNEADPVGTKTIFGTTQRNLDNDAYQLGTTIFGRTYSVDAGEVSIGGVLKVPTEFKRPNCVYFYYIDNIQTAGLIATYQKDVTDASNYNSEKSGLAGETDGYYYFKIGTSEYTYKRVQVKDGVVLGDVDCTADDWSNCWQDDDTLNGKYKGLEITKLMSDAELIGGLVQINVGYAFQTGLETNAGEGFVTSLDQNLWYTFETYEGPYLAHYTNAWGLQAMAGRDTRYTNDYLWSPLGDVYGFKMYNRYMIKNSSGVANVMTTDEISEGQNLKMAVSTSGREVYELLGSKHDGYFKIHPVINVPSETQYFVWKDPADNYAKLSTSHSEWTFNLPLDLLKPYIERVGYVGGLKQDAYNDNKTVLDKVMDGTATYADLLTVQGIVYNDENIVKYTPGYYRLHSQPGVSGISPVRYASGYLHETEKTAVSGGIPMHFYSKAGVNTTFSGLSSGFTTTNATRGDIPVPATENDPSTIFYFDGAAAAAPANPMSSMQTQGLYVTRNANGDSGDGKGTNRLQRVAMAAPNVDGTPPADTIKFNLMDIGGAVLLIHDGMAPAQRRYLNFDQSNFFQRTATDDTDMNTQAKKLTSIGTYYFKIGGSTYKKLTVNTVYVAPSTDATYTIDPTDPTAVEWANAADIYDLKYYHDSPTDDAKWCMQPVQKGTTAETNEMPLTITTNNGGDDYYYTTFCAPYDVKLPDNDGSKTYYAYISTEWDQAGLYATKVPAVTGPPSFDEGKFVPAGTPVVIRVKDESGIVTLTLPSTTPSASVSGNIFKGQYLEQLLGADASHDVYTLGMPFTTPVTIDRSTGDITAELPEKATSGLGFYINANPNKEHDALQSQWLRNNRYVIHNKIYYRETGAGARANFVPLLFDDPLIDDKFFDPEEPPVINDPTVPTPVLVGDVYDLMGRRVATAQQVLDGTWKLYLPSGVYIIGGKKVMMKRGN